jgi:2-phospho-L-lactate guanylyltransferase
MKVAVVPVKHLRAAKSRLSSVLPPGERESLVLALASHVLQAIRETGLVTMVAVATPDRATALALKAEYLPDAGSLNRTLWLAGRWAERTGASGLLILPCDLPLVTAPDVADVLGHGPGITIAPTRDGGTGALYLAPPRSIQPRFGRNSYARHILAAREAGVPVHEVERPGFRHDLDTSEDLKRFPDFLPRARAEST